MPQTASPFRYPGGKSQLYPFVENLLNLNNTHGTYIETFAGGASIPLKLLFNGVVNHIVINDFDSSIFSVWRAILDEPQFLINQVSKVPFDFYHEGDPETNIAFWRKQQSIYFDEKLNPNSLSGAFATIFLNRTNRSGIITGGPLGGWAQNKTNIGARFNKQTLIEKILAIHQRREDITISNSDALSLIPELPEHYDTEDSFIFFDPPYIEHGSSLYYSSLSNEDHARLAKEILSLNDYRWIVTYDHQPIIGDLYDQSSGRFEYQLNYSAYKHNKAPEFMFSSPVTKMASFKKTQLNEI